MSEEQLAVARGALSLRNPAVLASGVQGTSLARTLEAIKLGAGAGVTKSIGPVAREGYPEPTMVEVEGGWVNAAGLPNPGAAAFSEELGSIRGRKLPVIVSIFGGDGKEFGQVAEALDPNDFMAFELNLSCPHVEGAGTEVGHDPEMVSEVVKAVKSKTRKPVFAKLSPNTDRLVEIADAAVRAGADGLTAVNTVRSVPIDIEKGRAAISHVYGGLSGPAMRPIALRCVYELRQKFDVPIMGCGGVARWEDAVQYLLAGAEAFQIGTATLKSLALFNAINLGVFEYMERKGVKKVGDLVGLAQKGGWKP